MINDTTFIYMLSNLKVHSYKNDHGRSIDNFVDANAIVSHGGLFALNYI